MKWARENGCVWDFSTCSNAAKNGHLHILKWARKNGCEWNSYTCFEAAEQGHLSVLKWVRENGGEWYHSNVPDVYIALDALCNNHIDILKWIYANSYDTKINEYVHDLSPSIFISDSYKWMKENNHIYYSKGIISNTYNNFFHISAYIYTVSARFYRWISHQII